MSSFQKPDADDELITIEVPEINLTTKTYFQAFNTIEEIHNSLGESILTQELANCDYELLIENFHLNGYYQNFQLSFFIETFRSKIIEIRRRPHLQNKNTDSSIFTNKTSDDLMKEIKAIEHNLKVLELKESDTILKMNDISYQQRNLNKTLQKLNIKNEVSPNYFKQLGDINEKYIELKFENNQANKVISTKHNKLKSLVFKIQEYKGIGKLLLNCIRIRHFIIMYLKLI